MVGLILLASVITITAIDIRKKNYEVLLSTDATSAIKGFAALIVLVHHIAQATDGGFMRYMNFPSVALFFFISGYVTMYGYVKKHDYGEKILYTKIPTVIAYSLVSIILTSLFLLLIRYPITLRDVALCFMGNRVLNWFFTALIVKYLLFYLITVIVRDKGKRFIIAEFSVIIIYMIVCRAIGLGASWYCSSLAFPIGSALFLICDKRSLNFLNYRGGVPLYLLVN